jgi:hypothetical protein
MISARAPAPPAPPPHRRHAAICTPLPDVLETGTIAFGLPDVVGLGCGVVLAGCFLLVRLLRVFVTLW